MPPTIPDRWLWLGLGAFTFVAVKGIAHGLRAIVTLTEVSGPIPKPSIPGPLRITKEDAIKTPSLEVLATCENVEIRKSAIKILCDRFAARESSRKQLVKDLQSMNPSTKRRAQLARSLLREYGIHIRVTPPASGIPRPVGRTSSWPAMATLSWPRRNTTDATLRDRALRRRRREAMVINEGDRPLSQEDVWMRNDEGRMSRDEARPFSSLLEAPGLYDDGGDGDHDVYAATTAESRAILRQFERHHQFVREQSPSPESMSSNEGSEQLS